MSETCPASQGRGERYTVRTDETEGACGQLSRSLAQSRGLYRTFMALQHTPPTLNKPLRPCHRLPPTRLAPGHLPPRGRHFGRQYPLAPLCKGSCQPPG